MIHNSIYTQIERLLFLLVKQSRILKHAGDLVAAAAFADEARCMDLADRYVNSECVKRMLQADQVFVCLFFGYIWILSTQALPFSFSDLYSFMFI